MTNEARSLPRGVSRLIGATEASLLDDAEQRDRIVARLLTEGDRSDLRWLLDHVGADAVREGVERWGHRRLDRRNRLFWSWLLEIDSATQDSSGGASSVWPLA